MINRFSCRALCAAALVAGYATATCQAGQIFISSTSLSSTSTSSNSALSNGAPAVELLPAGLSRFPNAPLSDSLLSGLPTAVHAEAVRSAIPAIDVDSNRAAIDDEMAVARLEACRPLFNEWLKVARHATLDAGSLADGWSTSLVVPERAPRFLTTARKARWHKSVQQALEPSEALAANLMPGRPASTEYVADLDRLRL